MTTLLLIRHGRSSANTAGILAGWTPGVHLDEVGQRQAATLASRLREIRLTRIVASPLERTIETAEYIAEDQKRVLDIDTDARIGECHYGDWTGQSLTKLVKKPLWPTIQAHPSAVTFPGDDGEAMVQMQARAVDAVRDWNRSLRRNAVYAMISHGDVIKAILADALGMHLDQFQRIQVDPCSLSVIRYSQLRPFVLRMNDSGADLSFTQPPRNAGSSSDGAIGGGAGTNREETGGGKRKASSVAGKVTS